MKATFFHDTIFKKLKDKYYVDTDLSTEFLSGYLKHFDHLTIVAREEKVDSIDTKKYGESSDKNIDFSCIDQIGIKTFFGGKVKRLVRGNVKKCDFAIIRLPSIMGFVACAECIHQKKPYLVEVVANAFAAHWYHGNKFFKILSFPIEFLMKRSVKNAPYVIYITQEYLQKCYPTNGVNIGISDVRIKKQENSVLQKRINHINRYSKGAQYKVGLVGSLDVKYKGHREAIKSIRDILKSGIEIEMHFLGQMSEKSREKWLKLARKNGVEDKIIFDGTRPSGEGVLNWLNEMDLLIQPSYTEGLGRTLIEAMSIAVPCIGSNVGGIKELLSKKHLFKSKNSRDLARTVTEILSDKKCLIKNASGCFEKSKEFDFEKLSKKRDNFYKKIGLK